MIISHAYKFIFIRPRKVASSSIVAAIAPSLKSGDYMVGTPACLEKEMQRPGALDGIKFAKERRSIFGPLHHHSPLARVYLTFGSRVKDYKVITASRNPWERAVSEYFWSIQYLNKESASLGEHRDMFAQYIRKAGRLSLDRKLGSFFMGSLRRNQLSQAYLHTVFGKQIVDHVIQFENLQEGVEELNNLFDFEREVKLPKVKLKSQFKPKKIFWRDMYDLETKSIVEKSCNDEISLFGYKFDDA